MDLRRSFAALPARLAALAGQALYVVGLFLEPIVGRIAWTQPKWVLETAAELKRRPGQYARGVAVTLAVLVLGMWGWQWYLRRPHPPEPARLTFTFVTPAMTDYELPDGRPGLVIHPLEVKFSGSAAPIERIGRIVNQGITMDPALKGTWRWANDQTLRFVPAHDWPVGAHVEVQFDATQVFAPHVLMADDRGTFDMPAFAIEPGTREFYQDPQNPAAKKTIMMVSFNYPVDPREFEKRISLVLKGRDEIADAP